MARTKNVRYRGKYSCHDFPRLGVSVLYNCSTKKYGIYELKKKSQNAVTKYKPSSEIKAMQIILASVLGIVLIGHAILLISKFG